MKNDEEMAAIGRLVIEYAEAKKRKAILARESKHVGKLIEYVGVALQKDDPNPQAIDNTHLSVLDAIKVKTLVDDLCAVSSKVEMLGGKLREVGFPEQIPDRVREPRW